jgi:hypothetical protein
MDERVTDRAGTVITDLPADAASAAAWELSPPEIELVAGGMRCDDAGTAPTYDGEAGVCKSDTVLICG